MGVAEAVEADAGNVESADLSVEQLVERLAVDGLAGGVGEDLIVRAVRVPVSLLAAPPCSEHRFGVEVDAPSTGSGLDRNFDGAAGDDLAAPGDGEAMGGLVSVTPAEPGELTASHAGERCEVQCRMQPQVAGGSKEVSELFGGPALGAAALAEPGSWRLCAERGVRGSEVLAHGLGERGPDDHETVFGANLERFTPPSVRRSL